MSRREENEEARIAALLSERGINGLSELLLELSEMSTDTFLNTIKWWDDLPYASKGTGLLVARLREGGVVGYKRAHERTSVDGEVVVGPKQLVNLRSVCLTPAGIDRDTARGMCAKLAEKANTTPDELIDSALGADNWEETPPHPAQLIVLGEDPVIGQLRYDIWVHASSTDHPNPGLTRKPGEGDLNFSMRFWGWKDPEGLEERAAKRREAREALRAKAQAPVGSTSRDHGGAVAVAEPVAAVAPVSSNPELDERFGTDAPWDDEDLGKEDPW